MRDRDLVNDSFWFLSWAQIISPQKPVSGGSLVFSILNICAFLVISISSLCAPYCSWGGTWHGASPWRTTVDYIDPHCYSSPALWPSVAGYGGAVWVCQGPPNSAAGVGRCSSSRAGHRAPAVPRRTGHRSGSSPDIPASPWRYGGNRHMGEAISDLRDSMG